MKIKFLSYVCMFFILAGVMQPICAGNPFVSSTVIKVYDQNDNSQGQYYLSSDTKMKFKAELYADGLSGDLCMYHWLNFDFYKLTTDGTETNGLDLIPYYHSCNWIGPNFHTITPTIQFEPGDYIMVVRYDGQAGLLLPSSTTVKIHTS